MNKLELLKEQVRQLTAELERVDFLIKDTPNDQKLGERIRKLRG